jgi:hypothetical protein
MAYGCHNNDEKMNAMYSIYESACKLYNIYVFDLVTRSAPITRLCPIMRVSLLNVVIP